MFCLGGKVALATSTEDPPAPTETCCPASKDEELRRSERAYSIDSWAVPSSLLWILPHLHGHRATPSNACSTTTHTIGLPSPRPPLAEQCRAPYVRTLGAAARVSTTTDSGREVGTPWPLPLVSPSSRHLLGTGSCGWPDFIVPSYVHH